MGGPCGCIISSLPAVITQGSDVTLNVQLFNQLTKTPYSLAGLNSASAFFENQDGSTLAVSGSLVSSDLGTLAFFIAKAQSAFLMPGDSQSMYVEFVQNNNTSIVQFVGVLEVLALPF